MISFPFISHHSTQRRIHDVHDSCTPVVVQVIYDKH